MERSHGTAERSGLQWPRVPTAFDKAWDVVAQHSGAIVREVRGGGVHLHTHRGVDVVFGVVDLPALEAAVAMLRGTRGQ